MRFFKAALAGLLMTMLVATTACETMKGAGRDIEGAAENTEDAIDDALD